MQESDELGQLRAQAETRAFIDRELERLFAPEDDALRAAVQAAAQNEMPAIQISPLQGRLLQVLAKACGAHKILEIGALAGYSTIWLARALPVGGRLISLEVSEKHAAVARASLERAALGDRAEVRVGPAVELLATLTGEAPFDLIFIDADKPGYPVYLEGALELARPGSLIVADNCIRGGAPLRGTSDDPATAALAEYDRRVAGDPRLLSVALPIDEGGTDGFAISVVLATDALPFGGS
ncbi:MAG TPA: O-methyltransferase [Ktedonobacterales bacterium]|nr:O-methyltransferase [Ktedonobacterales bacterium]